MGLSDIAPESVMSLDPVKSMADLKRVGKKLAEEVDLAQLGPFVDVL